MGACLGGIIHSTTELLGSVVGDGLFLETRKHVGLPLNTSLPMEFYMSSLVGRGAEWVSEG